MTKDQFDEAKRILQRIDELADKRKKIEELQKREKKISTEYQKEIGIKIRDQYIHTPEALVNKNNFDNFLIAENQRLELEIRSLWDEFEKV